jgi:hypothetical protein
MLVTRAPVSDIYYQSQLTELDHHAKRTWTPHGCDLDDSKVSGAQQSKESKREQEAIIHLRDFSLTLVPAHFHFIDPTLGNFRGAVNFALFDASARRSDPISGTTVTMGALVAGFLEPVGGSIGRLREGPP